MAMNLSDHIIQTQYGFITFKELGNFCEKHNIVETSHKRNLMKALESIGAKKGFVKWNGDTKIHKAYVYVCLVDFSLHEQKEFWGKGVTVWE